MRYQSVQKKPCYLSECHFGSCDGSNCTTNPIIFRTAYGQDLNPPTTGKTSPHVTSTFGPNITGRANGSSTISNDTQGNVGNRIADDGNIAK